MFVCFVCFVTADALVVEAEVAFLETGLALELARRRVGAPVGAADGPVDGRARARAQALRPARFVHLALLVVGALGRAARLHACRNETIKQKKIIKKTTKIDPRNDRISWIGVGSRPTCWYPPPPKKSRGNVSTNGAGVTTHRLGERLVSSMMDTRRSQRLRTCSLSRQEVHHWWNLGSRPTGGRNFSKIFDKTQKKYRTFSTEFRREVERKTKEAAHFLSERWTLQSDR